MFKPHDWLDRAFVVGIIAKSINGIVEIVGGLLLLFTTPGQLRRIVALLTQAEVAEDPHDLIATYLVHVTGQLSGRAVYFIAIYLLVHGTVKVILVVALLLNKLWAYPWMITVLLIFIGYQSYRIVQDFSVGLMTLTAFDVVVVTLTWLEYRRQRRGKGEQAQARVRPSTSSQPSARRND